jgi:NitT/TauT family transport system substrate-binding protein
MMKKKMISMVLILTMATGLMTGCGSNETGETGQKETGTADTTENKTVTMASNPFVGLAPFYVAMDKGFFKDCGLDFSMVDFDDSSASCSALLAGKVDLAYTTLDAAIIAESQYDEDMLDVTAIVDESAGADGILVKNDINSIADLKGKTVGVSINQTSHYLLMQALETAGLTDADVDLVNMTSSDAGVSFISGDLDAAVTWEPYLSNAVELENSFFPVKMHRVLL